MQKKKNSVKICVRRHACLEVISFVWQMRALTDWMDGSRAHHTTRRNTIDESHPIFNSKLRSRARPFEPLLVQFLGFERVQRDLTPRRDCLLIGERLGWTGLEGATGDLGVDSGHRRLALPAGQVKARLAVVHHRKEDL
jgi:hypothetical protein